jgi:L-glutamine:2-deoxy-scyllo-inosose/3-amino-2,3-dideoxy-scyllo-inosose aminotransferase
VEEEFAEFIGARHCWLVANGTVALQLALEALDIGAGDEVILPGLTFQATAAAVLDVNAVPILVDVDPETYCIDPKQVESAITPRTAAIIPVHLYGCMADMDAILEIARKHNLVVIEDCAHTHGSLWRGVGAGALGDVGAFSMQQSKVITSGEGGAVTTNRRDLYVRLYSLRNCGRSLPGAEDAVSLQSGNYRITEWQAAVLLAQLERLEEQTLRRDENAQYLNSELSKIEGIKPMKRHPQVTRQAYYAYVFRYDSEAFGGVHVSVFRRALGAELNAGVGTVYEPLNDCSIYQPHTKRRYRINENHWEAIDPKRFRLPVATRAHRDEAVSLFHSVLLAERKAIDAIIEAVAKIRSNVDELREAAERT